MAFEPAPFLQGGSRLWVRNLPFSRLSASKLLRTVVIGGKDCLNFYKRSPCSYKRLRMMDLFIAYILVITASWDVPTVK